MERNNLPRQAWNKHADPTKVGKTTKPCFSHRSVWIGRALCAVRCVAAGDVLALGLRVPLNPLRNLRPADGHRHEPCRQKRVFSFSKVSYVRPGPVLANVRFLVYNDAKKALPYQMVAVSRPAEANTPPFQQRSLYSSRACLGKGLLFDRKRPKTDVFLLPHTAAMSESVRASKLYQHVA